MSQTSETQLLEQQLIAFRHDLHRHPELSFEEVETTKKIKAALEEKNIKILNLPLKTGVVAEVSGKEDGPVIALRSDIDALPIHEQSGVAFTSENDGVMHACGHDFHTSTLLGTAYLLKDHEDQLKGTVRLIFQPGEESGHGAESVVKTGVLDDVKVIFGLHNDPTLKVGEIGSRHHALTAGVDRFEIHINAKGAHAARPYEGKDPIVILAQVINVFQSIVSRNIASTENAVVSITQVHAGNTWNVIPASAFVEGTVRTFSKDVRAYIPERFRTILNGIAETFESEIELKWFPGPPSVENDPEWTDFALDVAGKEGLTPKLLEPTSIGEDFAFYQESLIGAFVMVGSGGPYALHHPKFRADDHAIYPTSRYFESLAIEALKKLTASV